MQLHSVADIGSGRCETCWRPAHPKLRGRVAGYAGFRTQEDGPVPRTILPLNLATLIVDFDGLALVTGPRDVPLQDGHSQWRHGVTIGLTPAGVSALLGVPMGELAGTSIPVDELIGVRAEILAEKLRLASSWRERFDFLDAQLAQWMRPESNGLVSTAWWRLQGAPIPMGRLADELGVSRRWLELRFRQDVGLTPKTVARVARFQRAVRVLSLPDASLGKAVACGYADQSHLTREMRRMAGLTPARLFAFVQDIQTTAL